MSPAIFKLLFAAYILVTILSSVACTDRRRPYHHVGNEPDEPDSPEPNEDDNSYYYRDVDNNYFYNDEDGNPVPVGTVTAHPMHWHQNHRNLNNRIPYGIPYEFPDELIPIQGRPSDDLPQPNTENLRFRYESGNLLQSTDENFEVGRPSTSNSRGRRRNRGSTGTLRYTYENGDVLELQNNEFEVRSAGTEPGSSSNSQNAHDRDAYEMGVPAGPVMGIPSLGFNAFHNGSPSAFEPGSEAQVLDVDGDNVFDETLRDSPSTSEPTGATDSNSSRRRRSGFGRYLNRFR